MPETNGYRRTQILLVVIGLVLGVFGTIVSFSMLSATTKQRVAELERRAAFTDVQKVDQAEYQADLRAIRQNQEMLMAGQDRIQLQMDQLLRRLR